MPIVFWAGHYIGLPFKEHGRDRQEGLDCWGLVRLALQEQYRIQLPSYRFEYKDTKASSEISEIIKREAASGWRKIEKGQEDVGDVIVLYMRGAPMHVGLVIGGGYMLHIEKHINSTIERYESLAWQERVHGFYRYKNQEKWFLT
jgi:cell wall-associated NlpC family hydrolase